MAKRKKVRKPRSKIGRVFAKLTALPGEEPVFEEPVVEKKAHKVKKKHVHVKELKAAVDSINAAASNKDVSKKHDPAQHEIDREYAEAFSPSIDILEEHTERWKKTGDTGLYIEPKITMKERVSSALDKYRAKRLKSEEKRWVDVKNVPFKPNRFLLFRSKLAKLTERKKKEDDLKDVFIEVVERADTVSRRDAEIDNIYKQLSK